MTQTADLELLTLQDAADRLKVHYMTAYRWVRRGDLPAFKTGGRLRVRADDLAAFVARRQVDVALPQHPGRTDWSTHVGRLRALLLEGAGVDAAALVRRTMADGAAAGDVYIRLLAPALHQIGDAWAAGAVSVAVEHRATEICSTIVARMSDSFRRRGPTRGTAVVFTPPGELHALACGMVADVLCAGGYDVHRLGPSVPFDDLHDFVDGTTVDLLAVSMTNICADPDVYAGVVGAAATATVVFGGQGADPQLAEHAGGRYHATLEEFAERLGGPRAG